MDIITTIRSKPWAAMLGVRRPILETLDCESMRSSFMFHDGDTHPWRERTCRRFPYPGRRGIEGMRAAWSTSHGVATLVWTDAPNRRMVEGGGEKETPDENRALTIFGQLGEMIPSDDLDELLAEPLRPVVDGQPWNGFGPPKRWLALLHSVAWERSVPGISEKRMTWPEGIMGTGCIIPDDIEPGEHLGSPLMHDSLSHGWVSELTVSPVVASLLLMNRIGTQYEPALTTTTTDAAGGESGEGDRTPRHKPGGYTTRDLYQEAGISSETLRGIVHTAGVTPSPRGAGGQTRTYSNAEIRKLIRTVDAGKYRNRSEIARAWRALIGDE